MKPSERIREIARRNLGVSSGPVIPDTEDILEYLDEQEQSSHAAKGERAPGQAARLVAILAVDCPRCGCGVGKQCFVGDGEDESPNSFHRERIDSAPRAKQHGGGRAGTPCADADLEHDWRWHCVNCGETKSPAPDADGGEEDGAREMYEWAKLGSPPGVVWRWEGIVSDAHRQEWIRAFRFARDLGRKDSAEALGRAEARLAAWEPAIVAALHWYGSRVDDEWAGEKLVMAMSAVPKEHRPELPPREGE